MIIGFIGRMGTGKTLSAVRIAYNYFRQGYKVYSNISLKFEHTLVNVQDLMDMVNNPVFEDKSVMLIDEAGFWVDSRNSGSKRNKIITLWLVMGRKLHINVLYTSQMIHQVDRRLRSNTDILIRCETRYFRGLQYTQNLIMIMTEFGYSIKKDRFKSSDYYDLYNTREVVRIE